MEESKEWASGSGNPWGGKRQGIEKSQNIEKGQNPEEQEVLTNPQEVIPANPKVKDTFFKKVTP